LLDSIDGSRVARNGVDFDEAAPLVVWLDIGDSDGVGGHGVERVVVWVDGLVEIGEGLVCFLGQG